jgi:hypothetical protein
MIVANLYRAKLHKFEIMDNLLNVERAELGVVGLQGTEREAGDDKLWSFIARRQARYHLSA